MGWKYILVVFCLWSATALLGATGVPVGTQLSLAGDWKFKQAGERFASAGPPSIDGPSWRPLRVPANWHSAGQDLAGSVWFSHTFQVPSTTRGLQVQLVFEGVDYAAQVWLNGKLLGAHEGYFEPFQFDVTASLSYDSENSLLVLVQSPNEEVVTAWSLHKKLIKGVYGQHDTRPGGAWSPRGQEQNTGGIWAPVYLRFSDSVAIENVRTSPHPVAAGPVRAEGELWELQIELSVRNAGSTSRDVEIALNATPRNFLLGSPSGGSRTVAARLQPGVNQLHLTLQCTNTQLWWSWDHGAPNLYQFSARVQAGGNVLDQVDRTVGFRTVEVVAGSKEWRLNGKRVFLRGTNYISTQWLSEMSREKYSFDVTLMKRANINAVRVHAHIEAGEFYRVCDEAGVLVWQDFALQWGYSEEPSFEEEAVRQALAMVSFLGEHPSIIGWTMHNEPPWDAPWMQYKYKDYDPQQNKRLDVMLTRAVSLADPTRYTHDHSATVEHPWLGWYSGKLRDYGKPVQEAFITEFGAQALPDMPGLQKIFGPEEIWPDTDKKWENWDYHNFEKHETFDIAGVALGSSPEDLIRNTQQYQAKLIQFAAESYRRQRYQPVTAIFQFMFVEDWPSVNWGVLDYWRNTKPGYDALAIAYQPVLPSVDLQKDIWKQGEKVSLDVWIINDKEEGYAGSQLTMALRRTRESTQSQVISVDIDGDSCRKISTLSWPNLLPGDYEFTTQIEDSRGIVLGINRSSFQVVAAGGSQVATGGAQR